MRALLTFLFLVICSSESGAVSDMENRLKSVSSNDNISSTEWTKILEALKFVQSVRFKERTPLFEEIFGEGVQGPDLIDWFFERVKTIEIRDAQYKGKAHVDEGLGRIAISRRFLLEESLAEHVSTLFHEAKHLDGQKHTFCFNLYNLDFSEKTNFSVPEGSTLVKEQCDHSFDSPTGIAVLLSMNISKFCINCELSTTLDFEKEAIRDGKFLILGPGRLQVERDIFENPPEKSTYRSSLKQLWEATHCPLRGTLGNNPRNCLVFRDYWIRVSTDGIEALIPKVLASTNSNGDRVSTISTPKEVIKSLLYLVTNAYWFASPPRHRTEKRPNICWSDNLEKVLQILEIAKRLISEYGHEGEDYHREIIDRFLSRSRLCSNRFRSANNRQDQLYILEQELFESMRQLKPIE